MPDDDRPPPPGFQMGLRLACGGLLGLLVGGMCSLGMADGDGPKLLVVTLVSVIGCALLTWRYGVRVWRWLADALPWGP